MMIIDQPTARLELTEDGALYLWLPGDEGRQISLDTADLVALIAAATAALAARAT
jgi:hypothetical protein